MNKLKFLRTEANYTIRDIQNLFNLKSHSMVSRIELGQNISIKNEMLDKFCNFFMVEANYFLGVSNEGILCKNALGQIITLNEEEYLKLSNAHLISFNETDGRFISKLGEDKLSDMRSQDFDKNMLFIMQGIASNSTLKEIIPLLSQLNETQLEIILNTIKVFIGK